MTIQLKAETMVAGGDALARGEDGRVVFVSGALPGEIVDVEITNSKNDYQNARVISIVEASADRVQPPCPHFEEGCGGCQWQHASMEAQQRYKSEIILDSLKRISHIESPPIQPIVGVKDRGYRSTIRAVGGNDGHLGLHRRQSNESLAVPSCLVADELLSEVLKEAYVPDAVEVQIRSSAITKQTVAIVPNELSEFKFPAHTEVVNEHDAVRHPKRFAQQEEILDRSWRVSAGSFFQSGPAAANLLAQTVVDCASEFCSPAPIAILDAYSGIGLLGGAVMHARSLVGDVLFSVEDDGIAASDASSNLASLNATIVNVEVSAFRWTHKSPPDLIVADPGRPGLGKKVSEQLASLGAQIFILVNCDPASMARDISILVSTGYQLMRIQPLDLFPHTSHIETVSCFVKTSSD